MADDMNCVPQFLREAAQALRARGAALSLHVGDRDSPQLLYADEGVGISPALILSLLKDGPQWADSGGRKHHHWIHCQIDGADRDILLLRAPDASGQSRLLLSMHFDSLGEGGRARVERTYLRYAPFAAEVLRGWQRLRLLEREIGAIRSALNLTDMGVILVDRSSRPVFANDAAAAMVDRADGLRLIDGSLRATRLQSSVRLQMALEHVINANARRSTKSAQDRFAPLLSLERDHAPPLLVAVLPIEERALEPTDIAAAVYVIDPTGSVEGLIQHVCKVYHLSPVETRLACLLTAGETVADAAKKMRIKEMTARSYLKQIFLKTNTRRQTSLVQLMLSSIIRTGPAVVPQPI